MQASDNVPPATNQFKGRYMFKELERVSKFLQTSKPITGFPEGFPHNSLHVPDHLISRQ